MAGRPELPGAFSGEDMRYTYSNGDKVSIVGVHYLCRKFTADITPPDRRSLDALIQLLQHEPQ